MSILGLAKSFFKEAGKELSKSYVDSPFLAGVTASCALVANADGVIEPDERKAADEVITGHSELSKLFDRAKIQASLDAAFRHATTMSGKQELARALTAVRNTGNQQMADDVYLVAADVANAGSDGLKPEETAVLKKIAEVLGVDTNKFVF
jgi:tellurite resistance protein